MRQDDGDDRDGSQTLDVRSEFALG